MAGRRRKKDQEVRKVPDPTEGIPKKSDVLSDAAKLIARLESQIKVIHGANDDTFDGLVGRTVADVREALVEAFGIPVDAASFVNGERVDGNYVLMKNDVLEFIRTTGVKPPEGTDNQV